MRVLLINPAVKNIIQSEVPPLVKLNLGVMPPLGLMYLAGFLKKRFTYEVKILDAVAGHLDYPQIQRCIQDFNPDVAGITTYTHNLADVMLTADLVKKINKSIHVCLGGAHVNSFPGQALGISSVDSIIRGEAEVSFASLIESLAGGKDLTGIRGVWFKKDGRIFASDSIGLIDELDSLAFPDRKCLDYKKYSYILGANSSMATMITSRGCPYNCIFCNTPKGPYRFRSPENIVNEMEECVLFGVKEIHFVDDTFNLNKERVYSICEEINKRRIKVAWSFRGRIDCINQDMLKAVKRAGCISIHLGVETSTDEGLRVLRKNITTKQIGDVFGWANNIGIKTMAYFLIGCPHETGPADLNRTIQFACGLKPDFALFNILTIYPDTDLYKLAMQKKIIKGNPWIDFVHKSDKDFHPPVWDEYFSRQDLERWLNLAYRRFYLSFRFLAKILNYPTDLKMLAKRLKAGYYIIKLLIKPKRHGSKT